MRRCCCGCQVRRAVRSRRHCSRILRPGFGLRIAARRLLGLGRGILGPRSCAALAELRIRSSSAGVARGRSVGNPGSVSYAADAGSQRAKMMPHHSFLELALLCRNGIWPSSLPPWHIGAVTRPEPSALVLHLLQD